MEKKPAYDELEERIRTLEKELDRRARIEEQLKGALESFRSLIESAGDLIYRINLKGHFTFFNPKVVETTGYSEEELRKIHYSELIRSDYREAAARLYERQYIERIPVTYFEFPMIARDGREVWLGQQVQTIFEHDKVVGFHAIARNISRRKLAELELQAVKETLEHQIQERTRELKDANTLLQREMEERRRLEEEEINRLEQAGALLRDSESRYRSVFENSGTATVILNADSTIAMANTEFEKLSGYTKAEIEGKMKWTEMVVPEDLEKMKDYFARRRKRGDSSPPAEYDFHFVGRDRRVKHIHLRVGMIPGTDQQVSSLTDITYLRETEKLFQDLFMNAEVGLYILQEGRFRMVNRRITAMTGYTEQELIGLKSMELVHPDYRKKVRQYSKEMLKGQRSSPYEFVAVSKQGDLRWILETVTPVFYQGKRAVLGNFADITKNKLMEREQLRAQRLESIGTLAAGLAHDFNNLLNVILGRIELSLISGPKEGALTRNLEEAKRACLRAAELAGRFITFSEGGAPRLKTAAIDRTLITATNENLSGTNLTAEFSFGGDLWNVRFDEAQIADVIRIVINNSVDAMPNGGNIAVSAKNEIIDQEAWGANLPDRKGRYVHIAIRDEGTGIPTEHQSRLFDPYFSTKMRGNKKGMGLGLATAYSIVQRHHGHIAVDSIPGSGTTVHIYLPASEDIVGEHKQASLGSGSCKGRVLVMDDEQMVLKIVTDLLRHAGYEVEGAGDGGQTIALYKKALQEKRPFAVVILDLSVNQGIGGKEIIKQLREVDPRVAGIVSSGYADDPVMREPRKYGFLASIQKPYGLEQLVQKLSEVMDNEKRSGQ